MQFYHFKIGMVIDEVNVKFSPVCKIFNCDIQIKADIPIYFHFKILSKVSFYL